MTGVVGDATSPEEESRDRKRRQIANTTEVIAEQVQIEGLDAGQAAMLRAFAKVSQHTLQNLETKVDIIDQKHDKNYESLLAKSAQQDRRLARLESRGTLNAASSF